MHLDTPGVDDPTLALSYGPPATTHPGPAE